MICHCNVTAGHRGNHVCINEEKTASRTLTVFLFRMFYCIV
jgi:hypothetical protein